VQISKEIREKILERDNHRCARCGKNSRLHVHHKVPTRFGGTDNDYNLETLCPLCHSFADYRYREDRGIPHYPERGQYKSKIIYLSKFCNRCEYSPKQTTYPINPICLDCKKLRRAINSTCRPNPEGDEIQAS